MAHVKVVDVVKVERNPYQHYVQPYYHSEIIYTMPKIVDEQMREATRRRIIHEAAREFARLAFDQANINVIAEQAGIGKGTIYLYFENKRDLFLVMLRFIAREQLAAIRSALARDGTLHQRLERLLRA